MPIYLSVSASVGESFPYLQYREVHPGCDDQGRGVGEQDSQLSVVGLPPAQCPVRPHSLFDHPNPDALMRLAGLPPALPNLAVALRLATVLDISW